MPDLNNPTSSLATHKKQLKKLRRALGIFQGTQLLATLQHETEGTVSHDQAKRVTYLTELFYRIHREIHHDWQGQATASHRPGFMPKANKRRIFREVIKDLVLENNLNKNTALFDKNGFVIRTDNIADRLGNFYHKMRSVRPFDYGNRITLNYFIITLGKLPAFKAVYEQGIDFRRLEAIDTVVLHQPDSTLDEVTMAFKHALDPTLTKSLENIANQYGQWPENKIFISGIPFLSHTTADGVLCLVTINGAIVPLESIKDKIFIKGRQFADIPLDTSDKIIGYLPGTEKLRTSEKHDIDGINISQPTTTPLFCLDVNMLTGLRSPSHTELIELLKRIEGNNKHVIFNLANNPTLKNKLLKAANGDTRLERTIEIGYTRLNKVIEKLNTIVVDIFEHKTSSHNPKLFMCMGGAGAGKTAVEEIAKAQCGNNFVIASLDDFRKQSDLYTVLTAANHHSDDYIYVEPFANRLRHLVAEQAKRQRIHILYDGTCIPYSPRYKDIISQFYLAGFHTEITAVDAFLVKPAGRENELQRSVVAESVKERFKTTGRALPWVVTIDKHIRAPRSFLTALEDCHLNKISLFANDGARNQHYLVAESFTFNTQQLEEIKSHQRKTTFATFCKNLIINHPESTLKHLSQNHSHNIESLLKLNPSLIEENVAYLTYRNQHGNRILIVYNTQRIVDFIEKSQLNPNASGEEGLLHKPESLAFDVDPQGQKPWIKRLQGTRHADYETDA
ncbi:MAG TPA: toxin [Methylococcaceae bacterium]|jgi:fido (protein-threonine AMPylation protein)|nr:toxin [Methylococcaceae bacterium]